MLQVVGPWAVVLGMTRRIVCARHAADCGALGISVRQDEKEWSLSTRLRGVMRHAHSLFICAMSVPDVMSILAKNLYIDEDMNLRQEQHRVLSMLRLAKFVFAFILPAGRLPSHFPCLVRGQLHTKDLLLMKCSLAVHRV